MQSITRLRLMRYGASILIVGLLVGFKKYLDPFIGEGSPFLLLLAGIMFAAWVGGFGPGMLATVLSTLLSDYFFLNPGSVLHQNPTQVNVQLGLFFVEGAIISWGTARLRRALAALRQIDRHKDYFLGMLAHEFRNHLAPISYSLKAIQLIHGTSSNTSPIEQAQRRMERQLLQLNRLIDDLMDITRIRAGKIQLKREQVELAAVVQAAVETSRPLIECLGHELTISLPPEPLYLHADTARLVQALTNLLTNAAKYTPNGGRIELLAEGLEGEVRFRVCDTGRGIPAELLPRVFDLFMQVDRTLDRAKGGLGIGLSLVRQIVHMHGGTVEAFSDGPEKGSEFLIRMPVLRTGSKQSANEAVHHAETTG